MFGYFTEDARKALTLSKKEKDINKSEFISTKHLLLSILNIDNNLRVKLNSYGLNYYKVKSLIPTNNNKTNNYFYSDKLRDILEKLIIDSKDLNKIITLEDLFLSIITKDTEANKILCKLNININKLIKELNSNKNKILLLDKLGIDLNEEVSNDKTNRVIGREKEINELIEILNRKNKCNPVLLGEAGVGKTAIVEGLVYKIINKEVPDYLLNKRIYSLDIASIVSGTKYRGEFEEKIKKIIEEVIDNNEIFLFIDEIHTLVGAGSSIDGGLDASNILKPYLARGKLKIIGATTLNEYSKTIEKDKALDRRFQRIQVKEPDKKSLKEILMNIKTIYEKHHGVLISEDLIDEIIKLSRRYIYNKKEPDRSIDILDDVSSRVSIKKIEEEKELDSLNEELEKIIVNKKYYLKNKDFEKVFITKEKEILIKEKIDKVKLNLLRIRNKRRVSLEDVRKIISEKSLIPLLDNLNINDLRNSLKSKIINQDKAIDKLVSITKKIKYNLKEDNKSYSLLFSGNTGVGKTYLAKEFSKYLTNNVIKLDMNEYIMPESINKLIGSPQGYIGYNEETLLDQVKNNPYSVLILDEIEKANKNILNFFLNILDEGYAVDNRGNKIRFDNVIIIMTTNAFVMKNSIGFNNSKKHTNSFPKEFINRIDEIIDFNNANIESVKKLIDKLLKEYNIKYNKELSLSKSDKNNIINNSDYNNFGYRKLKKLIKKELDCKLIETIYK